MRLRDIHETAVRMGIEADPRGKRGVQEFLARTKRRYEALPPHLRVLANPQDLVNPYADTQIYVGDPDVEVTTLLGGIDMNTGEVLLADRLREKGVPIDAIYTHHPEGWGLTNLDNVMEVQADVWAAAGAPIQAGDVLLRDRMREVRCGHVCDNYAQAVDAARLLDIPFFSAHTPTDNLVVDYLNKLFAQEKPSTIEDVQEVLLAIPEYRIAAQMGAGPYVGMSSPGARVGRILVDMTGGIEGPKGMMEILAKAGVGTIVSMTMSRELRDEADRCDMHVVIAGHMCSDSLGINLFLDELQRNGVKTIASSGLIRVHRDRRGRVTSEEPSALSAERSHEAPGAEEDEGPSLGSPAGLGRR